MAKNKLGKTIQTLGLGILAFFMFIAIIVRADFFVFILIAVAAAFLWKKSEPDVGDVERTRTRRIEAATGGPKPKVGDLYRLSPDVRNDRQKIGEVMAISRVAVSSPSNPNGGFRGFEFFVKTGKMGKVDNYLFKLSDIVLAPGQRQLTGQITVKANSFIPAGMYLIPDMWPINEAAEIGIGATRGFVTMDFSKESLELLSDVTARSMNSDERHIKEMQKIEAGGGNTAM